MRKPLVGKDYAQDPPQEHILKLLQSSDIRLQKDGLTLAQRIKEIEESGYLKGNCLERLPRGEAELWVISGPYSWHIIYAYLRDEGKILYLTAFNGDINANLSEAKTRLNKSIL